MFSVPRFIRPKPSANGASLRRTVFIDSGLQGRLLVALILLETSMLIAALIYLYLKFSGIIEANLYTIHLSSRTALLPLFIEEMITVILVMSVTNTIALIAAHQLWRKQVKTTTSAFVRRLRRFQALDFRQHPEDSHAHKVLSLLYRWQKLEIGRISKLKSNINKLFKLDSAHDDRQALRQQLHQCKQLLQLKPLSKNGTDS